MPDMKRTENVKATRQTRWTMTRSMTRWMLAGCLVLAVGALGAVGTPAQADPPANPFAGSWSGTWSLAAHNEAGTMDWTISDAGRITGRIRIGAIVGHVSADGKLEFVGLAPNDVPAGGFNGIPFQGTAVIDGDRLVVSASHPQNIHLLVAILERN